VSELAVIFGDRVAGTLTRLRGGRLRFDYADGYGTGSPLSLSMPVQVRSHANGVVVPWLWGLLPDNEAVLRRWARQFHASAASPFSLLSTPVGEDCAGAVRFVKPEELDRVLARPSTVAWLDERGVAARLRELKEDATTWLGRDFTGQFSLAGAQGKTALLRRDERWGVPSGAKPTTHILKPAVAGLDDHDLNEHLCLDAARRAGLIAARTAVSRFGDETAVVVARYDRVERDGGVVRVHQEEPCQALSVSPDRKYENQGGPGVERIAALLRDAMPGREAELAVRRFTDALIWNWLIAGTDAHAKNYSLLLAGDQVRLAPLYDVASALPYPEAHARRLRFAMKLGGDYRVELWQNPWPRVARELRLGVEELAARVDDLAQRAPDAFADSARDPEVTALARPLPALLADLVVDRARRCRDLLMRSAAS
jgi:serine/threonine-protein kinase HipA